jgi:hypothetical protein
MSNIHFNAQKKRRETKQGQVEIIETLNNPAEVISRQKKTEVMEGYLRTLCTCAKKNNPPNDGLDSLLYLQEENGVNLDEIRVTDEERWKSERHTGEKVKSYRYCQPEEVSESLKCLAHPLTSDTCMVECVRDSDGIGLVA